VNVTSIIVVTAFEQPKQLKYIVFLLTVHVYKFVSTVVGWCTSPLTSTHDQRDTTFDSFELISHLYRLHIYLPTSLLAVQRRAARLARMSSDNIVELNFCVYHCWKWSVECRLSTFMV
jgi:hypothetical protein